jgi:hypothetical protein
MCTEEGNSPRNLVVLGNSRSAENKTALDELKGNTNTLLDMKKKAARRH